MKRNTIIIIIVFVAILLAGALLFTGRHEFNDDYPKVSFSVMDTKRVPLTVRAGGYSFKSSDDQNLKESDFSISFKNESTISKYEDCFEIEKVTDTVFFSVEFDDIVSGVQVLRWPLDSYGTDSPLDDAERIAYNKNGKECSFGVEAGYLYSVYVTWSDSFIEYPFKVTMKTTHS